MGHTKNIFKKKNFLLKIKADFVAIVYMCIFWIKVQFGSTSSIGQGILTYLRSRLVFPALVIQSI